MAEFCWPWSKKLDVHGYLVNDVMIQEEGYVRPWNAPTELARLSVGVPSSSLWAHDSGGIN